MAMDKTHNNRTMESSLLLSIILSTSHQEDEKGGFNVIDGGRGHANYNNDSICVDSASPPTVPPPCLHQQSLTSAVQCLSTYELLREIQILDKYYRRTSNDGNDDNNNNNNGGDLYRKVKTLLFLYAVHRFHLPERRRIRRLRNSTSLHNVSISGERRCQNTTDEKTRSKPLAFCPMGYAALLDRRFEDAIDYFLASVEVDATFISPDDHDDIALECNENRDYHAGKIDGDIDSNHPHTTQKQQRRYVVPPQISLVSNLTFSPLTKGCAVMKTVGSDLMGLNKRSNPSVSTHTTASPPPTPAAARPPVPPLPLPSDASVGIHTTASPPPAPAAARPPVPPLPLPSDATSSALAKAYRELAFQTLAGQVRNSVRSHPGNEWMLRISNAKEQPLRWSHEMLLPSDSTDDRASAELIERTPVRMDLCHSCWSDIFFLAMDYPEAARVVNLSVDLAVRRSSSSSNNSGGSTGTSHANPPPPPPAPPIECRLKLTKTNPGTIKLTSVDLKASVLLTHVSQVFAFGADHLGLLKAALVASGVVPLGLEDTCKSSGCGSEDIPLEELLSVMMMPPDGTRRPCAYGVELTTHVRNIPKGSRLAVSTNLLGSIIAVCMRATRQISSISGPLMESDRRLVAARAILGEWLGGSGGGWQDSGGLWPGLKLISGVVSKAGDPEFGISRGRLLPSHRLLKDDEAPESLLHALEQSLVLVHGGMAQNVGPILEMVTEKYLLRDEAEWHARHASMEILDELLLAIRRSDVKAIARLVTKNFFGPIRTIIPFATNLYTETLIERVQRHFGEKFWGFVMCGGMAGGGMGFMFDPTAKNEALTALESIMVQLKREMEYSLPFAMDPVVFDYSVNDHGTVAELCRLEQQNDNINDNNHETVNLHDGTTHNQLDELLNEIGFDSNVQEQVRSDLLTGTIGLAKNRLSPESKVTDVIPSDVIIIEEGLISEDARKWGLEALQSGSVGTVTLAAGIGSRWTQGAGVVKGLNPFCCIGGEHRSFLDVHLAKNRRLAVEVGMTIPHAITTSWMTDAAISTYVESLDDAHDIFLSRGKSIGLRLIPTTRDLKFLWENQSHQLLDEQSEKVRESVRSALLNWAESSSEGSDYRDENAPAQCLSPVGHWYEFPNLLLNGTLAKMIRYRPQLKSLMLHNIDTIGADVDAVILGKFLETGSTLAFEVVPRCIDDVGGGLCRVNGKPRLVEGLALPDVGDELKFSYFNSLTTWIDIDKMLTKFGLDRHEILGHSDNIPRAINSFSRLLPTYITVKDVKKRWGKGQEDIYPVAQYEKLWGDMTAVEDMDCSYFVVSRQRGQQLKDPAQLDGWSRDGGAAFLDSICAW